MTESLPHDSSWTARLLAWVIAAVVFASVAPTLTWPQFTGGNENIVVQTALEMRHGGPWLVPEMMGEPRVKKPPLVAWITALAMRQETIDELEDPNLREQAYVDLSWQVRWTGLLAACVTIVATFELASVLVGSRVGVIASLVIGTTMLFQQYMRQSTSDVHLAMWVTIANACFAYAIFAGRRWTGLLLGAAATGMAFLCKGPVALLETVLPAIAIALTLSCRPARGLMLPLVTSIGVFALIALPWFVYVYATVARASEIWFTEVSRHGATDLEPSNPAMYLLLVPLSWPWVVMGVVGLIAMRRERLTSDLFTLAMIMLPLLVMVWFPDRKPRYLLPMLAPVAIACARGVDAYLRLAPRDRGLRWINLAHTLTLAGVCIALPLAGGWHPAMKTVTGEPWFPRELALWSVAMFATLIAIGLMFTRRSRWSLIVATFVAMLVLQALFTWGYRESSSGRSELKPLADAIRKFAPAAAVYDWNANGRRVDEEVAIYLNRTIFFFDPNQLPISTADQVYITRQGKDDFDKAIEPVPPPGWELLAKVKERKNHWWAFIRRQSTPAAP